MKNVVFIFIFFFSIGMSAFASDKANNLESFSDFSGKNYEVVYQDNLLYADVLSKLEASANEAIVDEAACCKGTCTIGFSFFITFSYSWCCTKCENKN